jgi:hypothetical protein
MHEACLDCVKKHISQAMIVHEEEVHLGYPEHIYRVIGHLGEASREIIELSNPIASLLRKYRLMVMEDASAFPPYTAFLGYLDIVIAAQEAKAEIPSIPDDIKPPDPA